MDRLTLLLSLLLLSASGVVSTTFTMVNKCEYTVWPGILSNAGVSPLPTTGFVLETGESKTISAPTSWGGRFWGRTLCSQDSTGKFSCVTGDCGSGKIECAGNGAAPPATLAEFTLDGAGGLDFFDVSLVDSYNVPMLVVPQGGSGDNYSATGCTVDLNGACPSELKVMSVDGQQGVACKSACEAFGTSEYCCSGAYATPHTCTPSSYSQIFKTACPRAYSYVYDDKTTTFTCASADYTITFCPTLTTRVSPPKAVTNPFITGLPLKDNDSRFPLGKPIIGIMVGVGALLILIFATFWYFKIKFWKRSKGNQEMETFIRDNGPLALTRYNFSDIKKMTKSFGIKLGQGGYGAVYKGVLLNGHHVAVKILTASKGNGQDFINEVASISRTSHINVVTLLGFCLEGQKKALIYEFMPNGSLDKFIHNNTDASAPSLTLEKFYEIAIGIARGLEYLHKGCNIRIVHFDIKPHNILLDEDFCPKISDFGLAKLCPRKESIISISDARGTIGYLAPEMWNRNFGGVSHKSDVYSYGMMLLDIVGERMNTNNEASSKSEKYFPDWIYSKLEEGCSLENGVRSQKV